MDPAELYSLMRPERICICRSVGRADIERAYRAGARDFDALQAATGCGTGCGTCETRVRFVLQELAKEEGAGEI